MMRDTYSSDAVLKAGAYFPAAGAEKKRVASVGDARYGLGMTQSATELQTAPATKTP